MELLKPSFKKIWSYNAMPASYNRLPWYEQIQVGDKSTPSHAKDFTPKEKAEAKEKVQALNDKCAALQALASKHDLVYSADHFGIVVPHPSGKRGHNKILRAVEEVETWLSEKSKPVPRPVKRNC